MEGHLERIFRSHVENCLKTLWETHELSADTTGYVVPHDEVTAWVSARGRYARVHAVACTGVRRGAKVLAEINEQNTSAWWTRTYWDRGHVIVEATMPWPMVEADSLEFTIDEVVSTAGRIGPLVTALHGGEVPEPAAA